MIVNALVEKLKRWAKDDVSHGNREHPQRREPCLAWKRAEAPKAGCIKAQPGPALRSSSARGVLLRQPGCATAPISTDPAAAGRTALVPLKP